MKLKFSRMKYLFIIFFLFLLSTTFLPNIVSAAVDCTKDPKNIECVFGVITPPPAIQTLIGKDPTGAGGISKFLSNFVVLIYSISAIVLIFMILWGAFDWMTSEGDKEKLANAQKKLINAFIGIFLLAITFAVIAVFGTFTGFTFFKESTITVNRAEDGSIRSVSCRPGLTIALMKDNSPITDANAACEEWDSGIKRP